MRIAYVLVYVVLPPPPSMSLVGGGVGGWWLQQYDPWEYFVILTLEITGVSYILVENHRGFDGISLKSWISAPLSWVMGVSVLIIQITDVSVIFMEGWQHCMCR